MQPPPQMMMAAEASKRQTMNMLMGAFLVFGLLALALSGMVWSYGNLGVCSSCQPPVGQNQGQRDAQVVWTPVLWNAGMFLLIFAIWGMAWMRQDLDPMAKLLLYFVSFIIILLIIVAPSLVFNRIP
jgi:hypothetical protein